MSNIVNSTILSMNDFPGHKGRKGIGRGGSLPRGGSGGGSAGKYKEGDTFTQDGKKFKVERGKHGLYGVSEDGKIVTMLPEEKAHLEKQLEKATSRTTNSDGNRASWSSDKTSPLGKAKNFKDRELAEMVEQQIDGYEKIATDCTTPMGTYESADRHHYQKNIEHFDNMAKQHNSELARAIADGGKEYWGYMSDYGKGASYTSGHIRDVYELKVAGKTKEAEAEAEKVIDKYQNDIKNLSKYKDGDNKALTKVDIMMMKDCIQSVKDAASLLLDGE